MPKPPPDPALAARLRTALEAAGISQNELARRIGADRGTVSRWLSGETSPSFTMVKRIAKELAISADFLTTGKDRTQVVHEVDKDARPVPLAGSAAAGAPMAHILDAADVQHFHFPEAFLRALYGAKPDNERAILLTVEGHSMEPDLPHHSLVFVDRGPKGEGFTRERIQPGEVYMVRPPGEDGVTLKRVSFADDWIHLEAINPDRRMYPTRAYRLKNLEVPSVVRGKVVGRILF